VVVPQLRGGVVSEDYDEQILNDLRRKTHEKRQKGQEHAAQAVRLKSMERELDAIFEKRGEKPGWQLRQRTRYQGTARP